MYVYSRQECSGSTSSPPSRYTLHPTPYTLLPTPYTLDKGVFTQLTPFHVHYKGVLLRTRRTRRLRTSRGHRLKPYLNPKP